MSPTVNIKNRDDKTIDARITATVDFHIKNGKVDHVDVTVTDGALTTDNRNAILKLLDPSNESDLLAALEELG